jgi:two-component system, sporulation sensor kinase E
MKRNLKQMRPDGKGKSRFLDKLIERVDRVGPGDVQQFLVQLVQAKGIFERVFEALQEGVIVAGASGRIHFINSGACDFFGLTRDDALGALVGERIRGLDWDALVGDGENTVVSRDMEVFYPENRFLNFYVVPIEAEDAHGDGEEATYVMLVRDITQNRRLTEETIESERLSALTMLAAGVAHEIGNPLNSLNIHLQLLDRKLRKAVPDLYEEGLQELVEIATGEVKRLDFIVEQFLRAIRPTQPQMEVMDVNALVRESVRFLEPELADRRIAVRQELRSDLPPLRLDGGQIKQAFYNLIRNAAQAIGSDGEITVRSDLDDEFVRVAFRDTGDGISAEAMSRIFQPYFTTKKSGTGLGLLIVRRIVREHGGEMRFESAEGEGTTVTLFLPRVIKGVRLLEG